VIALGFNLEVRSGGILTGSYNESFAFATDCAPGGIEPELPARKQSRLAWPGLKGGPRYIAGIAPPGNDQYITTTVISASPGWELPRFIVTCKTQEAATSNLIRVIPTSPRLSEMSAKTQT